MLITTTILAGAAVGAALVTGARVFGLRRIVKHSTKADVLFTGGIGFALAGTLAGMATALVAGLMMALVLSALKVLYRAYDALCNGWVTLESAKPVPAGADASEFDAQGNWVYNNEGYTA